jgi:hypothetical protein
VPKKRSFSDLVCNRVERLHWMGNRLHLSFMAVFKWTPFGCCMCRILEWIMVVAVRKASRMW